MDSTMHGNGLETGKVLKYSTGMTITAPSYITDMPADIYHAHEESISNSGLKLIGRSPAHYKYAPKRESTRSMVIGSALHMAILEPDLFYETYILLRNVENRVKKEYQEAKKEYGEEFVLVASECARIDGIVNSMQDNKEIKDLLCMDGHTELSGFAIDPKTGVMCRHRFDKLTNSGIGIDLKTTNDARPEAFSRSIMNYGYHQQAAFYMDQYRWITGKELEDFIFIAVESDAPFACKMYRLDDESIDIGREQYRQALNEYSSCKETGIWTAYYSQGVEEISLPFWALNRHDEEELIYTED